MQLNHFMAMFSTQLSEFFPFFFFFFLIAQSCSKNFQVPMRSAHEPDLGKASWVQTNQRGHGPPPRDRHTSIALTYEGPVLDYGGFVKGGEYVAPTPCLFVLHGWCDA
jgi:hypothetical protein